MYTNMLLHLRPSIVVPIYSSSGDKVSSIELPEIFRFPIRADIIRRVFISELTMRLQPKGRDPLAGKRTTAESLGIGYGIARVPRVKGSRRAAFIGSAKGGMATFPPRVEARIRERVNRKEKIIGIISALSATTMIDMVTKRGHRFKCESLPVIVESSVLESITKTRQAVELLEKLGLYSDIERAQENTRWRAGKGKSRGRRYKEPKSILFIVEDHESPFAKAVRNLPGVDVVTPSIVSVIHLAPGGVPGRLTLLTVGAIDILVNRFKVSLD
ncbi:MAG: 50S ribosomal protein L4 [Acidilobaceae archaeon]